MNIQKVDDKPNNHVNTNYSLYKLLQSAGVECQKDDFIPSHLKPDRDIKIKEVMSILMVGEKFVIKIDQKI